MEKIRERLAEVVRKKAEQEAVLDAVLPAMFGVGAKRAMRAASRHFLEGEVITILYGELQGRTDVERDYDTLEAAAREWMSLHYKYESLVRVDPSVLWEVKCDRFSRALADANNWPQ